MSVSLLTAHVAVQRLALCSVPVAGRHVKLGDYRIRECRNTRPMSLIHKAGQVAMLTSLTGSL